MAEENISVRQWQEKFRAGAFDAKDLTTQCSAGWYDWFCKDEALAGRLKRIARVVMGIKSPYILDNYYVWFKNNCPASGPLYDDARFVPLKEERNGKYFVVSLDSPHESGRWSLFTERYGFDAPEYESGSVREMAKYIDSMAKELEQDIEPAFVAEKHAVEGYVIHCTGREAYQIQREGEHCFSYRSPADRKARTAFVAASLEDVPEGFTAEQAKQIKGLYVFGQEDRSLIRSDPKKQPSQKKGGQER